MTELDHIASAENEGFVRRGSEHESYESSLCLKECKDIPVVSHASGRMIPEGRVTRVPFFAPGKTSQSGTRVTRPSEQRRVLRQRNGRRFLQTTSRRVDKLPSD